MHAVSELSDAGTIAVSADDIVSVLRRGAGEVSHLLPPASVDLDRDSLIYRRAATSAA